MAQIIANARMYAATPAVRDAWRVLFSWVGRAAGVPLKYIDHAAPAPIEELWSRNDLGAAFMCGFPFAAAAPRPQLIAAPIPSPPRYDRQPVYCTDFVVRADSEIKRLDDAFGLRIGWTAKHSQSGFNAIRHHLLKYRQDASTRLFSASIGPLVTPRRVIDALLERRIDVGPLDSYVHDLLKRYEPATTAKLRTIESTAMTPIPPLVASAATPPAAVERLRRALLAAASDPALGQMLARLLLIGFAAVDAADYDRFLAQDKDAATARYAVPS